MILAEGEERKVLLDRLSELGGWAGQTGASVDAASQLMATASDDHFPGAIIPRFKAGHFLYYLAADSPVQWRRLSPLAVAAVGVTLSDFAGRPHDPDAADPFESALGAAGLRIARLEPVAEPDLRRRTAEALLSLVDGVRRSMAIAQPSLRTTSSLLTDFDLAIALQDRRSAEEILAQLKSDARLEGINHLFLEIEALASASAWTELWQAGFFEDVAKAFRPPRVTRALLRATYWSQLDPLVADGDVPAVLALMSDTVLHRWGNLAAARPSDRTPDVVLPLLLACAAERTPAWITEEEAGAGAWSPYQWAFLARLRALGALTWGGHGAAPPMAPVTPRDILRADLIAAMLASDPSPMSEVLRRLEDLSTTELNDVLDHPLAQRAWEMLTAEDSGPDIRDWLDWATRLPSLDVMQARTWAREAITRAPVEQVLDRTERVDAFSAALLHAASQVESTTIAVLPLVLEWLTRDTDWPRPEFFALYRSLIDVLLLSDETSQMVVAGVSRLTSAVLAIGMTVNDYGGLCRDLGDWVGSAVSVTTIDALADLGELMVAHIAPDPAGRARFWGSLLSSIRPLERRLDPIQVTVLKDLDHVISGGVLTSELALREQDEGEARRPETLHGRVAVYTLLESVAKRVKEVVETSAPGVRVDFATDKVGSDRLLVLAREADVFAIDWSRAKHAATDFIRANRGGRPLLFTSGSGSSSIAREVLGALRGASAAQAGVAA